MDIQFYGTREVNVFRVECGVLLPKTDKEYNSYNEVYGNKNAYYDENNLLFLDKESAISYAKEYVNDGVDNTYAIVIDEIIETDIQGINEIKDFYWNDSVDMSEFSFDGNNILFSLVKTKNNGKIENFTDKEVVV